MHLIQSSGDLGPGHPKVVLLSVVLMLPASMVRAAKRILNMVSSFVLSSRPDVIMVSRKVSSASTSQWLKRSQALQVITFFASAKAVSIT